MKSSVIGIGIALALCAASLAKADPIDDLIARSMRSDHIEAVGLVVVKDGKILKLSAYGNSNLEDQTKAETDTAFQLASGTKVFTGVLVMRLVQEGKLDLSAPISSFFPDAPRTWRNISVAQLAAHTSGLPDLGGSATLPSSETVTSWAETQALIYRPGDRSVYNQVEFSVLAAILSRVSGESFNHLLYKEIVHPLGLTSTHYSNLEESELGGGSLRMSDTILHRAQIYKWDSGKQKTFEFLYPRWFYSAGGLFSSASDLAKLLQALDGESLLNEASKRELASAYKLNDGAEGPFGVAWIVRQSPKGLAIGHSGGPALSDIWIYPSEHLGIAVLTNSAGIGPGLADGVANLVNNVRSR